jgi:O-antigen ligase
MPLVLLGGRSDADADSSTMERLECWWEAIDMFRASPIFGVGHEQFLEHHFLTAHNSFLLALAELGAPGVFLFSCIMYLSVKVPLVALRRYQHDPAAQVAKTWSMALLASIVGMLVGAFLLSFTYHFVLWIHVALVGAFYICVRRHDPDFDVSLKLRDFGAVAAIDLMLLTALFVYTRLKV